MNDIMQEDPSAYLGSGEFVNADDPGVIAFARDAVGDETDPKAKALKLFYAVRDGIRYDAYLPFSDEEFFSAKGAVRMGRGWCVSKSALLAASARAMGLPARPGYADVKNHMATKKLTEAMGCDIFFWHSYCEIYLDGRWIKCTPAFNAALCDKFGLLPLDWDGETDSLFHPFDRAGNKHMEYIADRGPFPDVPRDAILATFQAHYNNLSADIDGDFQDDAGKE
jgi:transglutaminase-like putative cysteine protease